MSTPSPYHLLCIDVAPDSVAYVVTRPEAAHFSIFSCHDLIEAKEKIASGTFELILINLSVPETALQELIHKIRLKEQKRTIIGAISLHPLSEDSIRALKSLKQIDYIIQEPSFKEDIDQLLKELSAKNKEEEPPLSKKFAEIKRKYIATIPDLLTNIVNLVHQTQRNPDQINELKSLVHKIAGSAGSLGFHEATNLCKGLEMEIIHRLDAETHDNKEWLSSLDHFLTKIKKAFQIDEVQTIETEISKVAVFKKIEPDLLYVVDDNIHFLELLERVKEDFTFSLNIEFDPQKALNRLKESEFNPRAIICSEKFRGSNVTGIELIKILEKKSGSQVISGLLIENDSLDARLNAMKQGCDYVFSKPVSAHALLKLIGDLFQLTSTTPLKVLIVDDDVNFCEYAAAVLSDIGVNTQMLNDPSGLFKSLDAFKPDILLLDLMLPKYDGIHLLRTLRHDINYKNLIVIIVTSSEQPEMHINAYNENADYILFKPIDKDVLQKRILSIAKVRKISNDSSYQIAGLNSHEELLDQLTKSIRTAAAIDSHLVLFALNHFDEWLIQFGPAAANELTVYISNHLQWEADDSMKCFLYKTSRFAIVFEDQDIDYIEQKLYNFLTTLVQGEKKWQLNFNCAIVPISKSSHDAAQVLHEAEATLQQASLMETALVKIARRLPPGEEENRKEIIIVDPNPDLLLILKQAFESHGVVVKTFKEGNEALKEILSYAENKLPSLIIIERKLPDMDGMDLFLTLKHRFRSSIPVFMLTVFSADKDIGDGIKQGVMEYIIKPFNISLLVQKALKVMYERRTIAFH